MSLRQRFDQSSYGKLFEESYALCFSCEPRRLCQSLAADDLCFLRVISFVSRLCRALAAGNSRALRSRRKVLLRSLRFGLLSQNEFGSPSKNFFSRLRSGTLALQGAPAEPG